MLVPNAVSQVQGLQRLNSLGSERGEDRIRNSPPLANASPLEVIPEAPLEPPVIHQTLGVGAPRHPIPQDNAASQVPIFPDYVAPRYCLPSRHVAPRLPVPQGPEPRSRGPRAPTPSTTMHHTQALETGQTNLRQRRRSQSNEFGADERNRPVHARSRVELGDRLFEIATWVHTRRSHVEAKLATVSAAINHISTDSTLDPTWLAKISRPSCSTEGSQRGCSGCLPPLYFLGTP